jgi:hypothetical protein|tara:strand:- start:504 stop:767 length:264 start_codon:yes stop_codon:yes gene_type:complete
MNFYNSVEIEVLEEVVEGRKVCCECDRSINNTGTLSPILYYRLITQEKGVERSGLIHSLCFKDKVEKSLGSHVTFIPMKPLDLDSMI